jgi:hypothetical protein
VPLSSAVPADDDPVPMSLSERAVWAYLAAVVLTSGAYLALVATRLADQPAEDVVWVGPMLWTIGASVAGSVLLTVVLTVGGTVAATVHRSIAARRAGTRAPVELVEVGTVADARDRDIDLRGSRALVGALGAGSAGALALAMLDADAFWIGNLLFLAGTVGALVEAGTKLRLYRRGFS